jgi:hypothetical protein
MKVPTVTIQRQVSVQEAVAALQTTLGSRFEVAAHGSGTQEAIKVRQSAASLANVHMEQSDGVTTFHVHGGGLLISRLINEFGIAKKVASGIEEAFGSKTGDKAP